MFPQKVRHLQIFGVEDFFGIHGVPRRSGDANVVMKKRRAAAKWVVKFKRLPDPVLRQCSSDFTSQITAALCGRCFSQLSHDCDWHVIHP